MHSRLEGASKESGRRVQKLYFEPPPMAALIFCMPLRHSCIHLSPLACEGDGLLVRVNASCLDHSLPTILPLQGYRFGDISRGAVALARAGDGTPGSSCLAKILEEE